MDIFKNEEEIRIWILKEIFENIDIYTKLACNTKEKFGGAILKLLSFGTGSTNLAQFLFLLKLRNYKYKSQDF